MKLGDAEFSNHLVVSCDKDCNPLINTGGECSSFCFNICPGICKKPCVDRENLYFPSPDLQVSPPLLPQQPPLILPNPLDEAENESQKHLITTSVTIMGSFIGAVVLVCILITIFRFKHRISRRSRSLPPMFFGAREEDFLDEDQAPQIHHHVWYINTVGLEQSVIDLIAVFKYKKDERLIEATDCSVCLNEFQEDESLRLLPKCSHAFHIPCIDTWLRSHKNCPLCRAPIVSNNLEAQAQVESSVPSSSDLSSSLESQIEDSVNNSGLLMTSNQVEIDGSSEVRNGGDMNCALPIEDETNGGNSKTDSNSSILRIHSRVQSDLIDSRQTLETEMQPVRRSVSLDTTSAMAIYKSVANVFPGKHQKNLDMQMVKQLKHSKSKNVSKWGSNGSISFHKLMKSSSIGHALQKAPISMKRSFSSSGKSSSSRHTRSQDSILPL